MLCLSTYYCGVCSQNELDVIDKCVKLKQNFMYFRAR